MRSYRRNAPSNLTSSERKARFFFFWLASHRRFFFRSGKFASFIAISHEFQSRTVIYDYQWYAAIRLRRQPNTLEDKWLPCANSLRTPSNTPEQLCEKMGPEKFIIALKAERTHGNYLSLWWFLSAKGETEWRHEKNCLFAA